MLKNILTRLQEHYRTELPSYLYICECNYYSTQILLYLYSDRSHHLPDLKEKHPMSEQIPPYPIITPGTKILLTNGLQGTVKGVRGWGALSLIDVIPDNPELSVACVKADGVKAVGEMQARIQLNAIKKLLVKPEQYQEIGGFKAIAHNGSKTQAIALSSKQSTRGIGKHYHTKFLAILSLSSVGLLEYLAAPKFRHRLPTQFFYKHRSGLSTFFQLLLLPPQLIGSFLFL